MGSTASIESPHVEKPPRKVSIETFLRKYVKGGPGIKYEFNNGIIEKTDSMKFKEQFIILNLQNAFEGTPAHQKKGLLTAELEVWTSETQLRKPDLAFITLEQIRQGADGKEPMPEFIIEVISKNDPILVVKDKVYEYFKAGLKVLWHVFPHNQTVEIYRSPQEIEVCSGEQICSAEPVVEGFNIKTQGIFKKP
jgi:Uma2 family endonuclease